MTLFSWRAEDSVTGRFDQRLACGGLERRVGSSPMIKAVIFDLDGTMITTEDLIEDALKQAVIILSGKPADPAAFRAARLQMSMEPEERAFDIFCNTLKLSASPDDVIREYSAIARLGYHKTALTPGTERLVRHLYAQRVPMSIASNTPREKMFLKTALLRDVFDLIPYAVTIDDVERGKPDPEIMHVASQHLQIDPEHCLVFDDSPKGIISAKAAGMKCIGLNFRITPEEMPGADGYLPDLSHFDPAPWGLPGYTTR